MSTTAKKVEKKSDNKNTTLSKSPMLPEKLKFFKLNDTAQIPAFSTEESACFDLHANLPEGTYEEELGRDGFFGDQVQFYRLNPNTNWTRIGGRYSLTQSKVTI